MYLRVSNIEKGTDRITVNMSNGDDYKNIDISAIFIMAMESNAKQVICSGESTLQTKVLSHLAANLKTFGISMVVNSAHTLEYLQAKSQRGKYLKTLLNTGCLRCG